MMIPLTNHDFQGSGEQGSVVTIYPDIITQLHSKWVCLKMLCTPTPNGFADHYLVFKWLFHWEYTQMNGWMVMGFTQQRTWSSNMVLGNPRTPHETRPAKHGAFFTGRSSLNMGIIWYTIKKWLHTNCHCFFCGWNMLNLCSFVESCSTSSNHYITI